MPVRFRHLSSTDFHMNKTYRITRNKATGPRVVALEIARSRVRGMGGGSARSGALSLAVAIAASAPLAAYAAFDDAYLRIDADPATAAETEASGSDAVAIGADARAGARGSIAVGSNAEAIGEGSIALGTFASALGTRATAVGDWARAQGLASSALGVGARATGHDASAFGGEAHAEGEESTALGNFAYAAGGGSAALGFGATTGDDDAVAIGRHAAAHMNGSIAIGSGTAVFNDKSVALGYGSVADSDLSTSAYVPGVKRRPIAAAVPFAEVSVGYPGEERRITHVAAGAADTDAVNISQLKAVDRQVQENHAAINNIAHGNGEGRLLDTVGYAPGTNRSRVVFSGANGTLLANVGDGAIAVGSRDAVNGGQIAALRDDLQDRITGIDRRVGKLDGTAGTPPDSGAGSEAPPFGSANPEHRGDKDASAAGKDASATGRPAAADGADTVAHATSGMAVDQGASVADRANTVPAGSQTQPRTVPNVMAGAQDNDAVNVQQLNGVKAQVAGVRQSVDNLRSQVNQRFDQMNSRMNRLGAMNAAMSTMVASTAGLGMDNSVGIGTGLYRGQSALAIGYQRRIAGRMAVTISGSTAGSSEYSLGVGAGYGW
jgi:autotransporter adhesin